MILLLYSALLSSAFSTSFDRDRNEIIVGRLQNLLYADLIFWELNYLYVKKIIR